MQLRKSVTVPTRYEDEVHVAPQNRNGTKPAYPMLLKAQIVPFNPDNPPAAFPSLSLTSVNVAAVRKPDGSEELVSVPETLNSLSNDGLRINLAGSCPVQNNVQQAARQAIETATPQKNTRIPVESIVDGPVNAEVRSLNSEINCDVTWYLLPLSLQFHIYNALSANYPSKLVPQLLGLTEHETSQIQKAVGMRVLHPASVEEIWNYCAKASVEGETLQAPLSIDADVFNEYVDYMVFASNYELAFKSEVRLAKDFLSSRGIATEVLGTWLPDPLDEQFGGLFRLVPGTTGKPNLANNHLCTDSGYSSFSEADQTHEPQRSERPSTSKHVSIKKTATANRNTMPTAPTHPIYSIKDRSRSERPLLDLNPNLVVRISPHPRATITKVDELSRSSGDSPNTRELDEEIQTGLPQAGSYSITATFNNITSQHDQGEGQTEYLINAVDLGTGGSSEDTLAMLLSKAKEHFRNVHGNEAFQQLTQSSETHSPTGTMPNPRRLILKIHNQDGLARILRKKSRPSNWTPQMSPPKARNITTESLPGLANPSQSSSAISQPFRTNISGFSPGPTMKDLELSLHADTVEVPFTGPSACHPYNSEPHIAGAAPVACNSSKRKASQSDIRPDTGKIQRLLFDAAPVTPFKGISQGNNGDISQLHRGAEKCHDLFAAPLITSSETSIHTKIQHIISSLESAEKITGTAESTVPLDIVMPRSPVSPSYSPISENEDLEELQARLRGPVMDEAKGYRPDQEISLPSQPDLAPNGSLLSNFAFQPPARLATVPNGKQEQRDIGMENSFLANSRSEEVTLSSKGRCSDSESCNTASHLPSEQIQDISPNTVNDLASGQESMPATEQTSGLGQHQPPPPTNVEGDGGTQASLGSAASEQTSVTTSLEGTTQKKTVSQKKRGGKRGPRGPYKKTRERLAKLAEEEANVDVVKTD